MLSVPDFDYQVAAAVLGINSHPLGEPLDEDASEQFVIEVVTGEPELSQIALGLVRFAAA